jgi:hypothetical protein
MTPFRDSTSSGGTFRSVFDVSMRQEHSNRFRLQSYARFDPEASTADAVSRGVSRFP